MQTNGYVKIEGSSTIRDLNSKALLSTDINKLHAHKKRKELLQKNEDRIQSIETDVVEIKSLLQKLLDK